MQFDNQKTRNVADIAAKILAGETVSEELKGNQHKIDKNKNNKIDAEDFKMLRKEEEEICEKCGCNPCECAVKEETEQLQEYETTGGVYRHKGTYGYSGKGAEHGETDYDKENEIAKTADKPAKPARRKYGARQNYVRSGRVNEQFSNLVNSLAEGLKSFETNLQEWKSKKVMKEEPDSEGFAAEVDKAKKKNAGEDRNDEGVAAASVQSVKQEEVQVVDMTDPYNIETKTIDLEEREMTEPEMKKREEIVKSMKKGIAGFKDRYGERAKEVMYATATARAKGE